VRFRGSRVAGTGLFGLAAGAAGAAAASAIYLVEFVLRFALL